MVKATGVDAEISSLTTAASLEMEAVKRGKTLPEEEERARIIEKTHATGHLGVESMFRSIWHQGFWWPNIRRDLRATVQACLNCLRYDTTREGFSRIMQSDNGTEFVNELVAQLTKLYGIDHRLITAYHPRADGLVERQNKEVTRSLKKRMQAAPAQWHRWMPITQLGLNLRKSFQRVCGLSDGAGVHGHRARH